MSPRITHAWRAGLVLALLASLFIMIASIVTSPATGIVAAIAWGVGFVLRGAADVYQRRIELEQRKAAALARAAELEQLEQQLHDAPDDAARVRLLERLAGFEAWPLVFALVLAPACVLDSSAGGARDLDDPACVDSACEVMPEPDAQLVENDAGVMPADAGDVAWLELEHPHCAGAWADREDSSTRFVAHPDTGLCTFACRWLEPKCDEPWYGDPRCFPAHEQRLEQVCAELGGTCELAGDGERYCEAGL